MDWYSRGDGQCYSYYAKSEFVHVIYIDTFVDKKYVFDNST
jgi:hypothetical protein